MLKTQDKAPTLAVKEACLARSGVYHYSYEEMLQRGYTPKIKKPVYTEYRPPEVLTRCKDKFAFAVVTKEHVPVEVDHTNFRMQASGVVGDSINVKVMPSGDIGLYGKVAFYTKDAYDYYTKGAKETSADYRSVCIPDPSGKYDFILKDITTVNGLAITARGRGGKDVRVQDSAINNILGGINMAGKTGVLSFLGIGRTKDESFKLSTLVLEGVKTLHTLDAAGKEKMVAGIVEYITVLPDSDNKEMLLGAVKDSLNNPVEVGKNEEKVARVIDGLYEACASVADAESIDFLSALAEGKTQDGGDIKGKESKAKKGDDKDQSEADEKGAVEGGGKKSQDSLSTDELIDKIVSKVSDGIGGLIDKKVKEALGLKDDGEKVQDSTSTQDSDGIDSYTREEGAFLLNSAFGN